MEDTTDATPARHTCPRRTELWGPAKLAEGLDFYQADTGLVGQPRGCSYCGSLPPDDFMDAVRAGAVLGPTDKAYKIYLDVPNPEPDTIRAVGTSNSRTSPGEGWVAVRDMTHEQAAARDQAGFLVDDRLKFVLFSTSPVLHCKFYTPHLSPEQSTEFWELAQAGQVAWGYPGYPYAKLYLPGLVLPATGATAPAPR